jgi:hypothetical protein
VGSVDQELKQHLEAMESRLESRLDDRIESLDKRIGAMFTLVVEVKESLERQIEGVAGRFDAQAIRMDRQAAMLQTGARMSSWTSVFRK